MSGSVVLDATIALKAILPGADQAPCSTLLERLISSEQEILAPSLWAYETTSTLTKLVRFGSLTRAHAAEALQRLAALRVHLIVPDEALCSAALDWTFRLDRAAAYDSFYLALAESAGCDLWTADEKLVRAVDVPWVRSVFQ